MKKIFFLCLFCCFQIMAQTTPGTEEYVTEPGLAPLDAVMGYNQPGVHTDVVLVKRNDIMIFEGYEQDRGYSAKTSHLSWSMAKTISGILMAQASVEYKFSLNDPVKKFIPEFQGETKIIDLIQMSSGIDFTEQYFGLPVSSDVVRMLYLDGARAGAAGYVKSLPMREKYKPGDHFYYSSGDTNLMMEVLKKVINDDKKYENYPWDKFFFPLGIQHATFERDINNVFIGSSYIYMTALDYLRVGELIMNGGKWNQQQIIPEFYVKLMHTLAPGVSLTPLDGTSSARAYSAQLTTNLPIEIRKMNSEHPDLPTDAVLLLGHQGQVMAVSPSEKLVILRLAFDKGAAFKRNPFLAAVKRLITVNQPDYKTAADMRSFKESESKPTQSLINTKLNILDLWKVPLLIRRYTAKEYCSCRFVVGRTHEACYFDVGLTMPVMPKIDVIDGEKGMKKIVTQFFIGDENTAEFTGEKFGCRILN
jgi:CubicO group peptidase (beta-lactamase class C family)